jgi:hypothetical protein
MASDSACENKKQMLGKIFYWNELALVAFKNNASFLFLSLHKVLININARNLGQR